MFAMVTIFITHLVGWPRGGFVTLDVFFVISGFLITGNLLRMAEVNGTVPFRKFYWNRVRRIVPAATVVLILIYVAATLMFKPFRAHEVGVDAVFAFIFMANWRFAMEGTDYFNADTSVSPLQHYWSLSVEEQFYFVWPALIFVISLLVLRRSWSHHRRMQIAGTVMGLVIALSLTWAMYESAVWPARAYFSTFSRVWELGVGALLATSVGLLARIPTPVKPVLSWAGLAIIVASIALITDPSMGFPAPWAVLPVTGSALVIAAGVGGEPAYQPFLRNPISTYLGDISYSLYLVHWPVIILLADLMDTTVTYYATATALTLGLAIASYHFIENPLRRIDYAKLRRARRALQRGRIKMQRSTQLAAVAATILLVVALAGYTQRPDAYRQAVTPGDISVAAAHEIPSGAGVLPLASELRAALLGALKSTEWPQFDPSVEAAVEDPIAPPEVDRCGHENPLGSDACTWGSPTARTKIVVIGDSVAMGYLGPLRSMALNSNEGLQVHSEAQYSCHFIDQRVADKDTSLEDACENKRSLAVEYINNAHPDIVIVSHFYWIRKLAGSGRTLQPREWIDSLEKFINKFKSNTSKIVLMAPPPDGVSISECYGKKSNLPVDCVSNVSRVWRAMAEAEQQLAQSLGGQWVDSLPWFCYDARKCPSFVGTTLTKRDTVHMTLAYGEKITPVIQEALAASGVL
ncbi:acyltransferase family protein [Mycolicibacterium mucogenicum]|nr:acyltransferase family protein [Mycolicibacterium mucogenicum]